ncbi:Uncharacterised protein [Salmonella enterica subsp. arizonae]|nr:Uncharacterised protein [Salmonella enterica subsp. arizonae]
MWPVGDYSGVLPPQHQKHSPQQIQAIIPYGKLGLVKQLLELGNNEI